MTTARRRRHRAASRVRRRASFGPVAGAVRSGRAGAGAAARRADRAALVRARRARTRHLRARALRRAHLAAGRPRRGRRVVDASASLLGSIAGYFGGRVDEAISRVIDILLAFPGLLLAIALVAVLGPSLTNVVLALSLIGWVGYARLVRGQVLRAREFEFVQAARALGATTPRILARHVIPTTLPAVTRAGDARHGRRDPGGGGAQLPRPRRAAADAELGHDAELRPRRTCSTRRT